MATPLSLETDWPKASPDVASGNASAETIPFAPKSWLASRPAGRVLPRRTVRLRLSLWYGGLFLVCGASLLAIVYALVAGLPIVGRLDVLRLSKTPASALLDHNWMLETRAAELHGLLIRSVIALGIMGVSSFVFGWLMAGRVLRPLRAITATTRQISEANLHERLGIAGPDDELKELGDTIDALIGRLETAFEAQRSFVANASHELRTPITGMRVSLDVAERKSPPLSKDALVLAGKLRDDVDQADRLVESFLVLARAQSGVLSDLQEVCLREVTDRALEVQKTAIAERGLLVRAILGNEMVLGDETLLSQMVANLIDNAVRHSQIGACIDVRVEDDGPVVSVVVESGGPRLDQDEVSQLLQPFRRLGSDRTGSDNGVGLGLSIVAAIAGAHDGTVELAARPEGGLRVLVSLPRAKTSAAALSCP